MQRSHSYLFFVWVVATLLGTRACSGTSWDPPVERQFWLGEVLMPNTACPRLTFVVKFRREQAGAAWTGTMSIPRGCGVGGMIDTPLSGVVVTDERISFVTPPPAENTYAATRTPGENIATGQVLVGGEQAVPIRMWPVTEEEARNAAPRRPQEPEGALPYGVQEVKIAAPLPNGSDDVLAGTLTMPGGAGPYAAVVLVTDAEPQDRDQLEGTHKPYLVLADRLTRAGYAVLRCDDRGIGGSGGSCENTTLKDAAQDVISQVAFLAKTAGIDAGRIGVIGRGEGAEAATMAASEGSGIAFLVMLGPAGHKGIDVACIREERQLQAIGEEAGYISARVARLRKALELAAAGGKASELDGALREDARAYVKSVRGMGLELTKDQVAMLASSRADAMTRVRFRSWLETDPAESLKRIKCPVLVLAGELDLTMPAADEIPLVRAALAESESKKVVVKVLAGTNHAMQPCATGFEDENDLIETTISEDALKEIKGFLRSVTSK